MLKNIIFDVGGIILDDSLDNISKVYNKDMSEIYYKIFKGNFRECLLGNLSINDYINEFNDDKDYEYIKEILDPSKQNIMNPLLKDNYEYIISLKEKGYKIYLISNVTSDTLDYLKSVIDINFFDGTIFSCIEGIKKPDPEIFKLLFSKYNLNINESIYFDDKDRMVNIAQELGLNSIKFTSIEDIKNSI